MTDHAQPDLLAEILAQETRVWQALVAGDAAADKAALHVDFLGVYPSGFATRSDHCDQLREGATVGSFELTEARLLQLGADHVCLSYLAHYLRPKAEATDAMYVSSIWQRQDGGWVNVFSQDTPTAGSIPV
ncbi:MAG: DUF4440 domain-containing protein [Roseobacter sp. MedPE-SW]|nr:MAG: DUF4440 domain-containing protein [Roseobacter sp. MedPE-SW]